MTLAKTTSSRKRKEPRWGSLLRTAKKHKKSRRLGKPEVMAREEYGELEVDVKIEMIRSLIPLGLGVDGWAPYRCFKEATLQTCYNHLLHRCHELLETATRGAVRFPRLVKAILRHALALRDRRDAGEISPHGLRVAKGLLQAKMNRLLHGRFTNPANQRFAKHLRRYRDNLFVFLDRADVEATNYPAEQDIRIAVVNRKTCGGGNRTAKGAQAQSILMSVLQSCRHKGIRVIDIVTSILRAPDNTPVPLVNPER